MSEKEHELLSYMSLKPHLKVLRSCGIFPLDLSSTKLKKRLHDCYMCFGFSFTILYTLLQLTHVFQFKSFSDPDDEVPRELLKNERPSIGKSCIMKLVRGDIDKVMDSMFLLLTFLDSICKQIMFVSKPHKIQEILDVMKGPSFNQGLDEHRPLLLETVKQSRFLLNLFNKLCIVTCFLWILFPIISHFKQEAVEFTIWLPFDANKNPQFYIAICYVWLQTTWLGLNNSTMDIFIVYLFAQAKTQLSILRVNLENLVSRCKEEARTTSCSFSNVLECRFRGLIYHYNDIIKFSNKIEDIFNGPILFQFLVSGWIICTTAYRTLSMNPASGEFFSMILYMICILSELFLFCFYGNEVAYESKRVMESAYCMEWEEIPVKYRRYLVIFMERIKCPILPKAGKIVPLSINTFVQVVKTSYTFYTFLNSSQIK